MNIILSVAFIGLFCMDYYFMYNDTIKRNPDLTEKQRAHILSIKASTTLFLISIYFNYKFITSGFNIDLYTSTLNSNDNFLLDLSVFNLISYFITDCYIGYNKYHKYMCTLSGYTHHIVYIFISLTALYINVPGLYFLFMIEELPTIFLSSGNYNKSLRRDNIFGLTFFLTRLVYHGYLTWKLSFNKIFMILGILSFGLHSYWFKNWISKYFLKTKTNQKNIKQE